MTRPTSGGTWAARWLAMLLVPLLAACRGGVVEPPASTVTPAATAAATTASTPAAARCAAPAGDAMVLRVVDKQRGLPAEYAPADLRRIDDSWSVPGFEGQSLRREVADALVELITAGRAAGHDLRIRSGYRSYSEQVTTFQFWVNRLGEAQARRESAPAGHSEHQLGTTADLSSAAVRWELIEEFGATPEARWLEQNAPTYGFVLSYPRDAEAITGYVWEPWHIRYVGGECAAAWKRSGSVLVRFLASVAGATP